MSFDDLGVSSYRPVHHSTTEPVQDPTHVEASHAHPQVDPAATAAELQGAGEQFQEFAASRPRRGRAEPPMPGEVKGPAPTERTPQQRIEAAAERLAAGSPTARDQLAQFRAEGGTFVDGGTAGEYRRGPPPVIAINTRDTNGRALADDQLMQTVAHELGHDNFARTQRNDYIPPRRDGGGITDSQIELRRYHNYVVQNGQRGLNDEAHATLFNARVRDEMLAQTGVDIGVAGFARRSDVPLSREEIADYFARLTPSNSPQDNYRSYNQRPFREHYDRHHAPGVEGMDEVRRVLQQRRTTPASQ